MQALDIIYAYGEVKQIFEKLVTMREESEVGLETNFSESTILGRELYILEYFELIKAM